MEGQDNGLSIVNVGKIVYVRVEDKSFLRRMEIFNIAGNYGIQRAENRHFPDIDSRNVVDNLGPDTVDFLVTIYVLNPKYGYLNSTCFPPNGNSCDLQIFKCLIISCFNF